MIVNAKDYISTLVHIEELESWGWAAGASAVGNAEVSKANNDRVRHVLSDGWCCQQLEGSYAKGDQ